MSKPRKKPTPAPVKAAAKKAPAKKAPEPVIDGIAGAGAPGRLGR